MTSRGRYVLSFRISAQYSATPAEAAKALWPRMDVRPVERAAVYETYDEREKYTSLASSKIGNAVIDKPEDITYWLDFRKWSEGGEFT